jgi:hypothetical protein
MIAYHDGRLLKLFLAMVLNGHLDIYDPKEPTDDTTYAM